MRAIQRRWDELLATEHDHRLEPLTHAAGSGAPAAAIAAGVA
jgi:hypothetical protein